MIKDEDLKKLEEFKKKTESNKTKGVVDVSKDVNVENNNVNYDEIRKILKQELEIMNKRIAKGIIKEMHKQSDYLRDRILDNKTIIKDTDNKVSKLYASAIKSGAIVDEEEEKRKAEELRKQKEKEEKAKKLMAELKSLGVEVKKVE